MMETVLSNIFLLLFFISLVYLFYYFIRIVHLIISLKNDQISTASIVDIKNDLFESNKLKVLWFSISFILFYIFY